MIDARNARELAMSNPTFERKVELYNAVSTKINEAVMKGEYGFTVTNEEHLALKSELKEKGYKHSIFLTGLTNAVYYSFKGETK